ncbi:MAG: ribosome maturation factor RimM [Acidimicrobiia bacterium]
MPARRRESQLESSSSTEGPYQVGRLGRPHGLHGFLGLYIEEEDLSLLEPGSVVYLDARLYTVASIRRTDKGHQVSFVEVTGRDAAEQIRGLDVYVARRRQLGSEEYWPEDLIGLEVRPGGGFVVALAHGPSQARLVIERGESRFEIPFVSDLVPVVDVDSGYVEIVELPGLIEPSN